MKINRNAELQRTQREERGGYRHLLKNFKWLPLRLPPRPLRLRVSLHSFPSSPLSRRRNQTHKTKMKYKLTFALVAALTSTAFAGFQAPLPEFKNEKQLAEWRAEKASEATSQGYAAEETAFFTGKPYLASSGGYAFKYRSYKPELARWTSEDPSGFPDGANGGSYAPIPTCAYDPDGLKAHLVFENKIQNVSLTVYVHDHTAQNFTQAGSMAAWKAAVETAWTFNGTDQSNGEKLSFKTTISFRLQSGGSLNQSGALLQYDNVVTFTDATNLPSQVMGYQIGIW